MSELHVERQFFHWAVHVIIIASVGVGGVVAALAPEPSARWAIAIAVLLCLAIYGVGSPMTVRVNSERVEVTFGHLGWPRWRFAIAEILQASVIEFSPLRDFGGWGIRTGRDGTCLNQRGDRGVAFEFRGRRYIIGSDHPEALLLAMHTVGVRRK